MKFNRHLSFFASTSRCIALFILMLSSPSLAEDKLTFEEAFAHYTYVIANHVTWPAPSDQSEFVIALIGADQGTIKAFRRKTTQEIDGKPVKLVVLDRLNEHLNSYSLIFIGHNSRSLNKHVFSNTIKPLIISDGPVSRDEQMISLISSRRKVSVVLNQEVLLSRGFNVSIELLELAGTKSDFSRILKVQENQLKSLLEEINNKDKNLDELNSSILENSKKLEEANKTLEKNQLQLRALLSEVETSKTILKENNERSATQKQLLEQQRLEVMAKEGEVNALQNAIDRNRSILEKQLLMVNKQRDTIKTKDDTITTQRLFLSIIILVSIIFFVMIYFLHKSNRLRRQANKKLEDINAQLYEVATKDGMTQVFNRRHFFESAQKSLARQQRNKSSSTFLMLDIDSFKKINDSHGHSAGDKVIQEVAKTLNADMREYDILGRIGGEEFAMMITDCNVEGASEIANRLCRDVTELTVTHNGEDIGTSISIGLSQTLPEDSTVEQVLNRADIALYEAKTRGKNQVVVYSET